MLRGMVDGGTPVLPGIGSDIADPDAKESAYEGTPIEPLLSLLVDGIEPLSHEYAGMRVPLLLMSSPQDHVVEPVQADFLAEQYGGPLERITLERSYHVATQDYDKDLIFESTVAFATRVDRPVMVGIARQHSEPVQRCVDDRPVVDPRLRADDRARRDRRGVVAGPPAGASAARAPARTPVRWRCGR